MAPFSIHDLLEHLLDLYHVHTISTYLDTFLCATDVLVGLSIILCDNVLGDADITTALLASALSICNLT
jgi:hypothetical protein